MEPEDRSMDEGLPQEDDAQKSRSPTPSPPTKSVGDRNRSQNSESSCSDSDDNTSFLHEKNTSMEENDELAYDKLVESINNLILKSSCYPQDRDVPVERYVHSLLEKVLNHQKPMPVPMPVSQILCFPIRTLPVQNSEGQCDAGESDTRARDQSKSNGRKKRKSNEPPGNSRNRNDQDEDDSCDSQEEDDSNAHQKGKKPKLEKNDENLSCPFRKRNPTRFNVRDHVRNSVDLEDPEDGITKEVLRDLTARTNGDKIDSWESVWTRLFPNDTVPKRDHEPPVELDEVEEHYYNVDSVHQFVQRKTENGQSASSEGHDIPQARTNISTNLSTNLSTILSTILNHSTSLNLSSNLSRNLSSSLNTKPMPNRCLLWFFTINPKELSQMNGHRIRTIP
ncbi:hypothetical protein Daus18300_010032 [Diaporthe australafricana]|uniref:Uncharacterized protein n=1 Tax=Diaporthe australafricana TaxID=127596 RepID=A0ABR3WBV9_9PEZI